MSGNNVLFAHPSKTVINLFGKVKEILHCKAKILQRLVKVSQIFIYYIPVQYILLLSGGNMFVDTVVSKDTTFHTFK